MKQAQENLDLSAFQQAVAGNTVVSEPFTFEPDDGNYVNIRLGGEAGNILMSVPSTREDITLDHFTDIRKDKFNSLTGPLRFRVMKLLHQVLGDYWETGKKELWLYERITDPKPAVPYDVGELGPVEEVLPVIMASGHNPDVMGYLTWLMANEDTDEVFNRLIDFYNSRAIPPAYLMMFLSDVRFKIPELAEKITPRLAKDWLAAPVPAGKEPLRLEFIYRFSQTAEWTPNEVGRILPPPEHPLRQAPMFPASAHTYPSLWPYLTAEEMVRAIVGEEIPERATLSVATLYDNYGGVTAKMTPEVINAIFSTLANTYPDELETLGNKELELKKIEDLSLTVETVRALVKADMRVSPEVIRAFAPELDQVAMDKFSFYWNHPNWYELWYLMWPDQEKRKALLDRLRSLDAPARLGIFQDVPGLRRVWDLYGKEDIPEDEPSEELPQSPTRDWP